MKKILLLLLGIITVLSVIALTSCGETNISGETEVTYATLKPRDSTAGQNETVTESETTNTAETSTTSGTEVDPTIITGDPVSPDDYYDHSAQLLSLGFEEGSNGYRLYDTLFDISCKMAHYDRLLEGYAVETNLYTAKQKYYKADFQSLKDKTDALLSGYNVAYPEKAVLPPEIKLPASGSIGTKEYYNYNQKCTERFLSEADTVEEIVEDLKTLFRLPVLSGYAEIEELARLADEALEKIVFIKPYIEDPLRDETVEFYDEYDAKLDMVRLTVITTGIITDDYQTPGEVLFSGCKIESYTENGDGTVILTALISRYYAFENNILTYYRTPIANSVAIYNKSGLYERIPVHFQYPYYENSDIDWDAPVRVKSEQLHEALSLFFFDLKGTEGYTMRDLSMITWLQIRNEETYGQIWMYFNGNLIEFVYPEYYARAERSAKGAPLLPASQYYNVKGGRIENISEEDLAMFENLSTFLVKY